MDEKMKRLNFEVSRLISDYVYNPEEFKKDFEEFINEYYYPLDDDNEKGEYYHKVMQTYFIFSALINEKSNCELLVNIVQNEDILKKILFLLNCKNMHHKDLAKELGITYDELNKFIDKVYTFGVIYDLGCGKFDYVYSLTKKGKDLVNILKNKEMK